MAAVLLRRAATGAAGFLRRFAAVPEPLPPPPSSPPPPPPSPTVSPSPRRPRPIVDLRIAFRRERDVDRAADLLRSFVASASPSRLHRLFDSRGLFSEVAAKLRHSGRGDLAAPVLVDLLLSHPAAPKSEGYLTRVISLLSAVGAPDAAADAYHAATPRPTGDTALSALLAAFLRNGRPKDAIPIFLSSTKPGLSSHNVYLSCLCAAGEFGTARIVLDEMIGHKNGRPAPDLVSYHAVLRGLLKSDDDTAFYAVLKAIDCSNLDPNVATFNCRMARLCNKGQSIKAEELLAVMDAKNVKPNGLTFDILIQGYCKENKIGLAKRCFKMMKKTAKSLGSDRVSPDFQTYVMLLKLLIENGRPSDALEIWKECLAVKAVPPFKLIKDLADGLVEESKVEAARAVIDEMGTIVKGKARTEWLKFVSCISIEDETPSAS